MPLDAGRAIADLRELDRLTGGPEGARRVCWTGEWRRARAFLRERLAEIDGVSVDQDEAANLWATLPGELDGALAVGSHIDSVPKGGWLDGALGVMAGLEVLRAAAEDGARHAVTLVDFADEEGARFGRSLFGSSAVAGTVDPASLAGLRDAEGRPIEEVLREHDVELARIGTAARRRDGLVAYLELHIEQGPVLEREGVPVAAVSGTAGVERHRFDFAGQASHAGTTPMELRRDAGLAAATTALAVEEIAIRHGGVGTTGVLRLRPDIPTAVAGEATLVVDLRQPEAGPLATMRHEAEAAADRAASERGCAVARSEIWRIEPIAFDERLVRAALDEAGTGRVIPSGALHDAAEMARHLPVAMMFAPSIAGISHAKEEDTAEPDLERAIDAFGRLALRVARGEVLA
jgi:hydantoinase/carbamoylase family amidase